jgi:hypothetical protein
MKKKKRMKKRHHFEQCGKYTFDFTPLFTLVDQFGEPIYPRALPLLEKLASHFLYVILWLTLLLIPQPFSQTTNYIFMSAIFFHLFFIGCRLTSLLLLGGLIPTLFPPLWIRLTRKLQRNPSLSLLKKYNLHNHPGLLTNLALIQHISHNPSARSTLQLALSHAPNHPAILHLLNHIP